MPPCVSSSSVASSSVVSQRNGSNVKRKRKNQQIGRVSESDAGASDVRSELLRVLVNDADTPESVTVEGSKYDCDDDESSKNKNGNCSSNCCEDGTRVVVDDDDDDDNDEGISSGHNVLASVKQDSAPARNEDDDVVDRSGDSDVGGDTDGGEAQRPSSPFVVLGYMEHGGCLADQGIVELSRIALEEERVRLSRELAALRSAEEWRRRRLFARLAAKDERGRTVSNGAAPPSVSLQRVSRTEIAATVEEGEDATTQSSGRQHASEDRISGTVSKTSSRRWQQSREGEGNSLENEQQSGGRSSGSNTSSSGSTILANEHEKRREYGNLSEGGTLQHDGAFSTSVTEMEGMMDKESEGFGRHTPRSETESDDDDPLFSCRLMYLDDISEGLSELTREHYRLNGSAGLSAEKDGAHEADGACFEGRAYALDVEGGFLSAMPTGGVGTLEYVFDEDDAAKRDAFHRRESELILAEQRVIAKIEALMSNRLTTGTHYWQSNESVNNCPRCGKMFSIMVRKHHCRRCGSLLCNDCCSQVGRDMYASHLVSRCNSDGDGVKRESGAALDGGSAAETPAKRGDEWMFDTCDLTDATNVVTGKSRGVAVSPRCGAVVEGKKSKVNSKDVHKHQNGHGRGRGGLKVRTAPWCRICNGCYLVCLRARATKNYSDVLEDGRRRFHVLRDDEQSIMNFNTTWETRLAQLDVLKHLIIERTANAAHGQIQHVTGVVTGWMRNLGQRAESSGSE